ncbi:MAG: trigger factor, partial [Ignavibacteriaceae bacterium]
METKVNDLNTSEKELEVTLSYNEIKDDIDSEVKKKTKNIQLPGFRKGKAPLSIIKKMYGDALEYEASEKVANNQFWKIAKEKEIFPIGQPTMTDLHFHPNEDLHFKVQFETYPVLEVKEYTDLEIEVPDFVVKDEEIEQEIKYIKQSNATQEDADIVGEDNNYAIDIDLQRINEDGTPYQDSQKQNIKVDLSDPKVNPDLIQNAKGKKVGETFTFKFENETPVKQEENEKEKEDEILKFTADITSIKKNILPELTEELIKKVTKDKVANETDLRENIKKDIQDYYDRQTDNIIRNKLISMIVERNDFVPPKTLVQNLLQDLVKNEEERAKKEGNKLFNRDEAKIKLIPFAESEVKWFLLKNEIQKKEQLEVDEETLKELAKKEAVTTGLSEEKLLNYYKSSNYQNTLLDQKLFEFLKEKNTIKKIDPEEYSKNQENLHKENSQI